MKLALIYNKDSEATTGVYLEKVMKDAGLNYAHFWTSEAERIPREYDLYLRIDHGDYKYDLPEDLHPAVFYAIDTHLKKPYKKIRRQVSHYDIVFCAQKQGVEKLRKDTKIDIQWLPLGCDPQIHKKIDSLKKYTVGFVGSEARKFLHGELIDAIRRKYPDSFLGGADFREIGEIYSASKIGFNYSIRNDINMRIFEVMSSGTLLLTSQVKDNGFDELFTDRKNIVVYKNKRELLYLLEYYLKNDSQRDAIAQAGYELVTSQHTYRHRVQTMFNYLAFKFGGKFNNLRI